MLITRLLKRLSKADEDFHPEVRREFCVNSAENMIAVMEGVLWMAEKYVLVVLRQSSNKSSKFKCLRLEGSNFRLGGIAPITRAVPSFRVPMRLAVSVV